MALGILLGMIGTASAKEWSCGLSSTVDGYNFGFFVHYTGLKGTGTLTCRNNNDDAVVEHNIHTHVSNWGLGLGWSQYKQTQLFIDSIEMDDINDVLSDFNLFTLAEGTIASKTGRTSLHAENGLLEFEVNLYTSGTRGLDLSAFNFGNLNISIDD